MFLVVGLMDGFSRLLVNWVTSLLMDGCEERWEYFTFHCTLLLSTAIDFVACFGINLVETSMLFSTRHANSCMCTVRICCEAKLGQTDPVSFMEKRCERTPNFIQTTRFSLGGPHNRSACSAGHAHEATWKAIFFIYGVSAWCLEMGYAVRALKATSRVAVFFRILNTTLN